MNDSENSEYRRRTLEAIYEAAVDAIITIGERGLIEAVNPATEKLFGYTPGELIGNNISLLMPGPYREKHDGYLANYLTSGNAKIIGIGREVVAQKKGGTVFPIHLAISEIQLDERRVFVGFVRDLSDLKQVQQQEATLGRIIEESVNEVYIFDVQTLKFILVNRGARKNLGYSLEELRTLTPLDIKTETTFDQIREKVLDPLLEKRTEKVNFRAVHQRKNGTRYDVEIHLQLSSYLNSKVIVAIALDVTEQLAAERKLLISERLAAVGQMVAGLAHESRNALQRSHACLAELALDLSEMPESLVLVQKVQRALDDVNQLLEEVRSYSAPIVLERRTCCIEQLVYETWQQILEVDLNRRSAKFAVKKSANFPNECLLDAGRIQQVLRNLLENALFASPTGGIINVRLSMDGEPNSMLRIVIKDEGPGIPEADCESIFAPFFTTKVKGTGLGLAVSRRYVDAHQGRLFVDGGHPTGATFVVELPVETSGHKT